MCENGCGTVGATTAVTGAGAPQSLRVGGSGVDDLQAEAVVDQLLHRHRPGRETASRDLARAGGGLGEYYSEHETRTPTWLLAGDTHTVASLVGLTDAQRADGKADAELVARWLDDGIAPNGAQWRAFGQRGVHGFDLTFCAPKSVSLVRALRADDVVTKGIADAHTTALAEAMEYLATHAGYTRIHNPSTGEKDLVRLPGLAAIAYQHETSRYGDPHLHTHVVVPNRQARTDGQMASIDGTSLYHEARAAGVIYQTTLRRELHQSLGLEWAPIDPTTGMAELAGVAERRSPPGRGAPPSSVNGLSTTCTSSTNP
jgi:conjugative relaxase-like TrwC/TraI family protein